MAGTCCTTLVEIRWLWKYLIDGQAWVMSLLATLVLSFLLTQLQLFMNFVFSKHHVMDDFLSARVIQAEFLSIFLLSRCLMNAAKIQSVHPIYTRCLLPSGYRNHSSGDCHKESAEGVKTGEGYRQHWGIKAGKLKCTSGVQCVKALLCDGQYDNWCTYSEFVTRVVVVKWLWFLLAKWCTQVWCCQL
jgi:hypothetical protein